MQVMFDASEEMGEHAGLGLLPGRVRPVPAMGADGKQHRIPHIGWRPLLRSAPWEGTILADVQPMERVYFVHSFMAVPLHEEHRLADTVYGDCRISAAIQMDNVIGCQFHPEKSGVTGLRLIQNFVNEL